MLTYLQVFLPVSYLGGKHTVKVVLFPSWLSKVTVPPKPSVMRLITANPKP